MATITGFTSARMLAMEAATIVDGDIVGNDLVLTKHDGSIVVAGNVRGPTGSPGVTQSELAAQAVNNAPVGTIVDYISTVAPTGWLTMMAQTVANAQTLYPALWAVCPASMKSGSSLIMPDTRGRVSVGLNSLDADFDSIGDIGGSKTVTLTQAQLPAVGVTVNPPLTTVVISDSGHVHVQNAHNHGEVVMPGALGGAFARIAGDYVSTGAAINFSVGIPTKVEGLGPTDASSFAYTQNATATMQTAFSNITANVDINPFASSNMGSGAATPTVPPFITFLKIIKAI